MEKQLDTSTVTAATRTAEPVAAALPSVDYTTIRGKNVLVSPTEEQYELLRKRLKERIDDSRGETIFEIGIGEGRIEN